LQTQLDACTLLSKDQEQLMEIDRRMMPASAIAAVNRQIGADTVSAVLRHDDAFYVVSKDRKGRYSCIMVFKPERQWVVSADVQAGSADDVFESLWRRMGRSY
jgi:hypothetical protein